MSLYWPPGAVAGGEAPRLHALVIGVGAYDHLGLNVPAPSAVLTGLSSLTTTPLAAKAIAEWLLETYNNPRCPLGSIELLLSPTETLTRPDITMVPIEAPTMQNIVAAFNRWRALSSSNPANIAFFYFAGHGISTTSHFLLPSNFGDPAQPNWANLIDFSNLQIGMQSCPAQTQLFFVDACREASSEAINVPGLRGDPLNYSTFQDVIALSAAYFAAAQSKLAYGRDGQMTFFSQALLWCLDGLAAAKNGPHWQVDAAALSNALAKVFDVMARVEKIPLSCECRMQKPVVFHYPATISVLLNIDCQPAMAKAQSTIKVAQGANVFLSSPGEPRPWMKSVAMGATQIEITFNAFAPFAQRDILYPPTYDLEVLR